MAFAINYIGANDIGGDGSGNVSSSIGIGTASADRIVVVVLTYRSNAFCTTPTLGGSNMTLVKRDTETTSAPDARADMYKIRITTGTTATLATTGLTPASNSFVAHVYTITGASWTETDSDSITGTSVSVVMTGLTIPATGKGIVGFCNVTSGAVANTGYNEDSDANSTVGTNNHRYSTGNVTTTGTNNLTFDGATASQVAIGAAWDVAVGPVVTIGTGQEVATLHAFEAILAADGGITEPWIGSVNNEEITETIATTFTDYGQDGTNTITIQPQTGEGFADLVDYSSTALDYPASGARILNTTVAIPYSFSSDNFIIQGLAFRSTKYAIDTMFKFISGGNDCKLLRCIGRQEGGNSSNFVGITAATGVIIANCLCIVTESSSGALMISTSGGGTGTFVHNTYIYSRPTNSTVTAGISCQYGSASDCTVFGNAIYNGNASTGKTYFANNTKLGDYNVRNNANDSASPGSNGSTSGVIANDFEDALASSAADGIDMRAKSGGLLLGFIPSASRWTTGNYADTDIRGQTRVSVNNDVGCFQKTVAATGLPEGLRAANFTLNF